MNEKKQNKEEKVCNELISHRGLSYILIDLYDTLTFMAEKKAKQKPTTRKPKNPTFSKWLENIFYSMHAFLTKSSGPECGCGSYSLEYKGIVGVNNIENLFHLTKLYICKKCGKEIYKTEKRKNK